MTKTNTDEHFYSVLQLACDERRDPWQCPDVIAALEEDPDRALVVKDLLTKLEELAAGLPMELGLEPAAVSLKRSPWTKPLLWGSLAASMLAAFALWAQWSDTNRNTDLVAQGDGFEASDGASRGTVVAWTGSVQRSLSRGVHAVETQQEQAPRIRVRTEVSSRFGFSVNDSRQSK